MEGITIGFGLELRPSVEAWFVTRGLGVDLTAELREGRYVCTRLEVTPRSEHLVGVTSEGLRELPVANFIEVAARHESCEERLRTEGVETINGAAGPHDVTALEVVAAAYRYGHAIGDTPTREVMQLLGLTRSRAGRWVNAARDAGLLAPTREREPGGVLRADELPAERIRALSSEVNEIERRIHDLEERQVQNAAMEEQSTGSFHDWVRGLGERLQQQLDAEHELLEERTRQLREAEEMLKVAGPQ
jgi:hypothetical protein